MRRISRSNIIENILLKTILASLKTSGPAGRRELEKRIRYEKLDFGEHNSWAKEIPHGWSTPRCYNNASWAITSAERAGYVKKHGGRGGSFEITPEGVKKISADDHSLRQDIEAAWDKHMATKKPNKPLPEFQYSYQMFFTTTYKSHEDAWQAMHKTTGVIAIQNNTEIKNSGIHQLPSGDYLVWHILQRKLG